MTLYVAEIPIACDMAAIPRAERERHGQLAHRLFDGARAVAVHSADGVEGVRVGFDAGAFDDLAAWMTWERLCCPFLRFGVEVAPAGGAVTLELTGPAGTRAFLEAELGFAVYGELTCM